MMKFSLSPVFLFGLTLLFAGIAVWFHDVEQRAVFITFTVLASVTLIAAIVVFLRERRKTPTTLNAKMQMNVFSDDDTERYATYKEKHDVPDTLKKIFFRQGEVGQKRLINEGLVAFLKNEKLEELTEDELLEAYKYKHGAIDVDGWSKLPREKQIELYKEQDSML